MEDVLQSSYYKSPLGYNNVDWVIDEVLKLENKIAFYFENIKKDIIMTEKDEEDYKLIKICQFCEKNIECDKVGDHCHLTSNYRGPAPSICNINVTQHQSNFIPFIFHNFSNYDSPLFFKKLVDKKNGKVKFDNIPKANEEYISVTYSCIRFVDSYRLLSSSLDSLVQTLVDNSHKTLKDFEEEIVDNDEILISVIEVKIIFTEGKYKNYSFKDLKKDYPDKIRELEEALVNCMGETDLKFLKT